MSFSHPGAGTGAGKASSSADMGGDPKKQLFSEQVMTEQAPPEVPPTSAILGFHFGGTGEAQGRTYPCPFPFLGAPSGVQVPPNQNKKMREEDALFNSCLSPQLFSSWGQRKHEKSFNPRVEQHPSTSTPRFRAAFVSDRSLKPSFSFPTAWEAAWGASGDAGAVFRPRERGCGAAGGWGEPAAGAGAVTRQPLTLLRCLADVRQPGRSRNVMQSTRDGGFFPPKVRKAKCHQPRGRHPPKAWMWLCLKQI